MGWPVFAAINSNYSAAVNGNGSWALVYLGGIGTVVLAALLVWVVINEIARAQQRAGIVVDPNVTLRDVLLAKVGIGLEEVPFRAPVPRAQPPAASPSRTQTRS